MKYIVPAGDVLWYLLLFWVSLLCFATYTDNYHWLWKKKNWLMVIAETQVAVSLHVKGLFTKRGCISSQLVSLSLSLRCSSRCRCRPWVATQTLFLLSWYFPFFLAALVFSAFWYELIPCFSLPSSYSGMYYCFQGQKDSLLVASKVSTREYSMCISKKKRVLLGKKELEPDYLTLDKSYFVLMLDWTLFIRL